MFPALVAAFMGADQIDTRPTVRIRPVSPKDWPEKLEDATVVLAVPGGCETFTVLSTAGDRLTLSGKPLGKFGPGDEVSFHYQGASYTFAVHRVSAGKVTLWPR